jgi:transcription factor C subunit 6
MSNPRRSLRPREKPIDYSQLISFDTDQDIFEDNLDVPDADVQEGSSSGAIKRRVVIEDEDSGSEFDATAEPEVDQQWDDEEVIIDDVEPIDELALASEDNNGSISQSSRATAARSVVQRKNIVLAPGLARQSNRQMHARPLPAMHHRHRFMPLFHNTGLVEQMLAPPLPFKPPPPIGNIGSGTHDERISDRTGRSWSHNVGPGPVWEMVEDRAWYSEAVTGDEAEGKPWNEAFRRPLCYEDVNVRSEWEALSYE